MTEPISYREFDMLREDMARIEATVIAGFAQINGRVRATETAQASTQTILGILQKDGCDQRCRSEPSHGRAAAWGSGAAATILALAEGLKWWLER